MSESIAVSQWQAQLFVNPIPSVLAYWLLRHDLSFSGISVVRVAVFELGSYRTSKSVVKMRLRLE